MQRYGGEETIWCNSAFSGIVAAMDHTKNVTLCLNMNLEESLRQRMGQRDIRNICSACAGVCNDLVKEELYSWIGHPEDRIGYNALWVFTHFPAEERKWLVAKRDDLIAQLMATGHPGKRRLILMLLEQQPVDEDDVRSDYLDYCLSKINSNEPCGIRVLCLKQAFALCRFYPELMAELKNEMDLMECGALSAGLLSASKNIRNKISRLKL